MLLLQYVHAQTCLQYTFNHKNEIACKPTDARVNSHLLASFVQVQILVTVYLHVNQA
jgi:hypothetical protein